MPFASLLHAAIVVQLVMPRPDAQHRVCSAVPVSQQVAACAHPQPPHKAHPAVSFVAVAITATDPHAGRIAG